jgi:pyrroline-5-carboxylate reductase
MTALPSILLVGGGRMGGAMLRGWQERGLAPSVVLDPAPETAVLRAPNVEVVGSASAIPAGFRPEAVVLAVKPQVAAAALPTVALRVGDAVALSIMAGRNLAGLAGMLPGASLVRAMPNTPAAIGRGISVACAGPGVSEPQRALCDALLAAVGEVAWVEDEALLDAVTAVSGSGPAYVFLLAELLERAAVEQDLPPALARQLARATVAGAGALLAASGEDAAALRRAVTSPGGTTERALAVLMDDAAWPAALSRAVAAATERSRELAG